MSSSSSPKAADYKDLVATVSQIVGKISGNKLGEKQAFMVETRLKKRMLDLKLYSPEEYLAYIQKNMEKESGVLVSLLTTHHTFFFREFGHFEYLQQNLVHLVKTIKDRGENTLKIWSAACSRGQEVYSLSMFLNLYLPKIDPSMKYEILGSDIDPESVKIASNGVYHRNEIKEAPMAFIANHWVRGTGTIADYVKAKDSIKAQCKFEPGNLLKFNPSMAGKKFDVIFCRNVFIYFEKHQIEDISRNLLKHLHPHGLFFTGMSESLSGYDLAINSVSPSVYMHKSSPLLSALEKEKAAPAATSAKASEQTKISTPAPAVQKMPDMLRVLCVDDSASILTILKKTFSKEFGFEVVATAKNGIEAAEMAKKHTFDIMTLDIHMPEMDGVTYLQKHFSKTHPPVVMISSASRDDSSSAMKALQYGASDFVEKPALNNMAERSEEIRAKLKMAYWNSKFGSGQISSVDQEFSKKMEIKDTTNKIRIIFASYSEIPKLTKFFGECASKEPATIIFSEGQDNLLKGFKDNLKTKYSVDILDTVPAKLDESKIYLSDFGKNFDTVSKNFANYEVSVIVFGTVSKLVIPKLLSWKNLHLLAEDTGALDSELRELAADVVPFTSFAYMSNVFFAKNGAK